MSISTRNHNRVPSLRRFGAHGLAAACAALSGCHLVLGLEDPDPDPDPGPVEGAPSITSVTPADKAGDVDPGTEIRAVFSRDLDATTVTDATFQVRLGGNPVPGTVTYEPDGRVAVWRPGSPLVLVGTYTATVTAGVAGVDGTHVGGDVAWTFTVRDGQWGAPAPIEGAPKADYLDPGIAVDPAGNAMVIWDPNDLWARRSTATGWDDPKNIESEAAGVSAPHVAVGPDGVVVAVWGQRKGPSGLNSAWANRYVPGTGWGKADELEVRSAGVIDTRIAASDNGRAVAVWTQHRDDGMGTQVIANRFTNAWEGAQSIVDTSVASVSFPSVAFDRRGNAFAVWSQSNDGSTSSAWANRMTSGWTGPKRLDTLAGSTSFPEVAGDEDGNAIAAWAVRDDKSVFHLRVSQFSPDGNWTTATTLDNGFHPHIAFGTGGDAILTYLKGEVPNMTVWAMHYRRATGWGKPEPVSAAGGAGEQALVIDARGNAVAVWSRSEGLHLEQSMWASRYTAGGRWTDPRRIDKADGDANYPRAGVDARGRVFVVWQHAVTEARIIRFE